MNYNTAYADSITPGKPPERPQNEKLQHPVVGDTLYYKKEDPMIKEVLRYYYHMTCTNEGTLQYVRAATTSTGIFTKKGNSVTNASMFVEGITRNDIIPGIQVVELLFTNFKQRRGL